MDDFLKTITDEQWDKFRDEMKRVVGQGHHRPNVPASEDDIVQSAFASFLRRRQSGEKREMAANDPNGVLLVLLYRAWSKTRAHHDRATYAKNSAIRFTELRMEQGFEGGTSEHRITESAMRFFVEDALALLSDRQRQCALLCLVGNDAKAIAHAMEMTAGEVSAMLLGIRIRLSGDNE